MLSVVVGLFLILACMSWLFLPEIAAIGLGFAPSRAIAKKAIRASGPRSFPVLFRNYACFGQAEWLDVVNEICQTVEKQPGAGSRVIARFEDLDARGHLERTILHQAAEEGCQRFALNLLRAGAEIDPRDCVGKTPLHCAAAFGRNAVVDLLIREGADVNARAIDGDTPLHWAAYDGHLQAVKLLLRGGADIPVTDNSGKTPCDYAVEGGFYDVVALLQDSATSVPAQARPKEEKAETGNAEQ